DLRVLSRAPGEPSAPPFGVRPSEVPAFPLESEPGDVVLFDQNLWHASFGGRSGRRMFTLNFAARPAGDEHIAYLRRTYESNLEHIKRMQYTQTGRVYEASFLESERPRIHGM